LIERKGTVSKKLFWSFLSIC